MNFDVTIGAIKLNFFKETRKFIDNKQASNKSY